ncbi:MAG: flagellar basal body P-ring formation chaperone FlgA [Opitutus sp.]
MRALRLISLLSALALFAAPSAKAAASTPLARDQFIAQVATELSNHFKLEGELQLELLRPWSPPARVAQSWAVEMLEFPSVASSSMLVRCRVLADGVAAADTTLVLRAALWRDVWVARQPLMVGATFDAADLETRRVDLMRERDALPAVVGDRSYSLARGVSSGRVLTWRDIARRPLVRKGNLVEVSAGDGQLMITMKALAMENGAHGDTVTVRNQESRKDFAAMVVDENRVQVRF